ncbi:NAD(P)H-binding protein [Phenylobacterium kunshanense]|uniref:Nucleoside-diphosphate sugar epimerase n=1 Tax=Phenylobacterium kunshanense TaxID=1445034 RepID=A0A328BRM3_9CAUL|nr:NAD(P)H-binding protein [Phenylobacterium kunshanense]RAK69201.1 nucleoside-diphosphate sugar epimerase [Phenylobacterium kunshanense]
MRVLLTGATGFIGSAILTRLQRQGHEVIGVTRRRGAATERLRPHGWIELDLGRTTTAAAWRGRLTGVDAVVNCAGVLQDGGGDTTLGVHRDGPAALFEACQEAGVRKVIQISAIGADLDAPTEFQRTKALGDAELKRRALEWIILRPAIVLGPAAYGGSALIRSLASLPFLPRIHGTGTLQFVQVDDVAETVARLLEAGAWSQTTLDLAAPETFTFDEVVALYRRWLGHAPTRRIGGGRLLPFVFRLGDIAGLLGWRPPVRTTARRELERGVSGDGTAWMTATGVKPQSLEYALASRPASVQERWFATLYLLKPLLIGGLSLFWIVTALIAAGPAFRPAQQLMADAGAHVLAVPATWLGIAADLAVGIGLAFRRSARAALWAGIMVSFAYLLGGTLLSPGLWVDPLGPLTKILPVVLLHLACLAILDDR